MNTVLDGEGAECILDGLFVAAEKQHVDNHTRIDHVQPHCRSRELYKGVLGGAARGIFNGKIYVHKNAAKTDAKQTNNNLLLSKNASVDTKPQLEIYNNDVKCTNGSTIGQIDAQALFYLRSRGLAPAEAQRLLTFAFASEVIGRIKLERLRLQLENWLLAFLQQRNYRDGRVTNPNQSAAPRTGNVPYSALDVERVREEFPILAQLVRGKPLVYLRQCRHDAEAACRH